MTDELTLKILAEIAAPGSGHLFSRRGAAQHAIAMIEGQAARIAELEAENRSLRFVDLGSQAAEPYAYELHLPNDEYSLVYAGYLAKYATEEERACERLALYAAPVDHVIREALEATFEQRAGYLTKVSAAIRAIAASEPKKD